MLAMGVVRVCWVMNEGVYVYHPTLVVRLPAISVFWSALLAAVLQLRFRRPLCGVQNSHVQHATLRPS